MAVEDKKWKELEEEADKVIRETNEMLHLRAEYEEDVRFRSKDDFVYLDEKMSKSLWLAFIYVLCIIGIPIIVHLVCFIFYARAPLDHLDKSPLSMLLTGAWAFLPWFAIERTDWYDRNFKQLKYASILKGRYEKAESLINRGMDGGWKGLVETGLFRLLELKDNFSEMPDYDKLVKKAQSWIEEKEKNEE